MRLGIVLHGPEIIDSGRALALMDLFEGKAECEVCLGGAMGAIAVIDAHLEDRVDINREKVSQAIVRLDGNCDAVLVLNRSKTRESGVAFGSILSRRFSATHPVIQLDDGFVMPLNRIGEEMAASLSSDLDLDLESSMPVSVERGIRTLNGVEVGENIWINGNVIGTATSSEVTISIDEGGMPVFNGVDVKKHGLEKVIPFDLETSLIRSGRVRRTLATPRSKENGGNGTVMLVDHSAEESFFETRDASVAVTVGDDTTRIAGNLLYRKGIPIVGIIDGDEDGICGEDVIRPGSVIVRLRPGNDDLLGVEVRRMFFGDGRYAPMPGDIDDLARSIVEMAGDRLVEVTRF